MITTIRNIVKSSKRLDNAENTVLGLENTKKVLEKEIEYKQSAEYIEEVARNELNLIKPGEEIYIYPKDELNNTKKGNIQGIWNKNKEKKPIQAWIELFFK